MTETIAALEWYDAVGILGVGLYLTSYVYLQRNLIVSNERGYSTLSLLAACLILVSLSQEFNLAATLTNLCWVAFSLIGLILRLRGRARRAGAAAERTVDVRLRRSSAAVDEYEFI